MSVKTRQKNKTDEEDEDNCYREREMRVIS